MKKTYYIARFWAGDIQTFESVRETQASIFDEKGKRKNKETNIEAAYDTIEEAKRALINNAIEKVVRAIEVVKHREKKLKEIKERLKNI